MIAHARMKGLLIGCVTLLAFAGRAGMAAPAGLASHPMPNTVITVSVADGGATLDVAVPLPELRLAMQRDWIEGSPTLDERQRTAIAAYFGRHVSVRSMSGVEQSWQVRSISVAEATNDHVGKYQELRIRLFVPTRGAFDPRRFVLAYDAVIHRIPNHFASVQIAHPDTAGNRASDVGIIRFDFARDLTPPLSVNAEGG